MKRSEMIEIIEEGINQVCNGKTWTPTKLAKCILSTIEQNGMLPPENSEQITEGEELGFKGITRVSELEWEKE